MKKIQILYQGVLERWQFGLQVIVYGLRPSASSPNTRATSALPLPSYSPHYNPIEKLWKQLKQK
jgi:transposase